MKKILWTAVVFRWLVRIGSEIDVIVETVRRAAGTAKGIKPVMELFDAAKQILAAYPDTALVLNLAIDFLWWALLWFIPITLLMLSSLPKVAAAADKAMDVLLRLQPRARTSEHLVLHYITPKLGEGAVDLTSHGKDSPFALDVGLNVFQSRGTCYVTNLETNQQYRLTESQGFQTIGSTNYIKLTKVVL